MLQAAARVSESPGQDAERILTALGRGELRDQQHMHLSAYFFGTDTCLKPVTGTQDRDRRFGSVVRNETGTRVAIHSAQVVGSTCLPEATSNIRRRKWRPATMMPGLQTSCVPPRLSKRSF